MSNYYDYDKEALKKYIEKLLSFENKNNLTDNDLKSIASDMGLNSNDLKIIESNMLTHLKKADGFLKHQCYNEAIEQYNQAYGFNPLNIKTIYGLAQSYCSRYLENNQKSDKELSLKYANIGIELDPGYNDFYSIIKNLKNNAKVKTFKYTYKKTKSKNIVFLTILFVVITGIFFVLFLNNPNIKNKTIVETKHEKQINKESEPNEFDVPVIIDTDNKIKNINFIKDTSIYKKYNESYSYDIKGEFFCPENIIKELTVKLSLLNNSGNIVNTKFVNVITESDEEIYPGDSIPFNDLIYEKNTPQNIKQAIVKIYYVKSVVDKNTYELKNQLPVIWEVNKPDNTDFNVYQRSSTFNKGFGTSYHFLVLRIKNTGNKEIKLLKIGAKWFDENNKEICSNYVYVLSESNAPLRPGVIRQSRIIGSFKSDTKDFTKFKLSILEIK